MLQFVAFLTVAIYDLTVIIYTPSKAMLVRIIVYSTGHCHYDCKLNITIVNCDCKTFIEQATG
jgi:hypothetical protein